MRLENRVAIVTGGGSGIGRAVCLRICQEGGKAVIADVNGDAAGQTARLIERDGRQALALEVDITRKDQVRNMVARAEKEFGKIDILVNNAGTDIKGSITEIKEETWDFLMTLNLKGTFLCTQAVVPSMMKRHYGRIVNLSSMAGKTGEPFTSAYCTTKFGVIGFTQSVALELGKENITINAVCPGPVETDLIIKSITQSAQIAKVTFEEYKQKFFIGLTPLGRMAKPEDVARAVAFLASDEAEFITGTTLNVSGGREMH
jgi:NAD(P)-dependent dehydrogenase (short-subunit alcohol dehydrogenase family)